MQENNTFKVLIFEDDQDLVNQWIKTFKQNGLIVEHAMNVEEAIEHCNQTQFDAIVLDICITDNNGELVNRGGFTLLSSLRNTGMKKTPPWAATVPVLVVTGYNSIEKMGFDPLFSAKALGGQHITETYRKPFKPEALYQELIALINKHRRYKKPVTKES